MRSILVVFESSEVVPPVVIEQVLVEPDCAGSPRRHRGAAGAGTLEIHYTGLSFSAPEYVRFRYRLSDLDEDWTDAGTRRTAYYSYLPPGRHTFSVIAADRNGVWNTDGAATMAIEVLPPFYRTWWFTTAGVAVLGGRAPGCARAPHPAVHTRTGGAGSLLAAADRIAGERTQAHRGGAARQPEPDPGRDQEPRAPQPADAGGSRGAFVEQIGEIADAATHAIDEVREIAYNLRPHHLDRLGLTKAIDAMIEKIAGASTASASRKISIRSMASFPSETEINVYRIVQEGVTNIVKHADASEASLTIKRTPRGVAITLRDNGRGFVRDDRQAAPGRGFGLVGIAERARLLGGEPIIESAPGQGTTIRITLAASR